MKDADDISAALDLLATDIEYLFDNIGDATSGDIYGRQWRALARQVLDRLASLIAIGKASLHLVQLDGDWVEWGDHVGQLQEALCAFARTGEAS